MKLKMLLAACFAAAVVLADGRGERELIWPEGKMPHFQESQVAAMTDESAKPGFKKEEHRTAYVEWLTPPAETNRNGACLVLISGGGYWCCCDCWLVDMWNRKFTAEGYQCVNFVYRTPRPAGLAFYQSAWEDGQRAIRFIRAQAQKRGFDPERIGTISMSAGSHLATLLATSALTPAYEKVDALDDVPCHVAFAITGAIAYGMTDGLGIPNSRQGDGPDVKLDSIFKFDAKTAPMCMFHGGADEYSPFASTHVFRKLRQMKIPSELHLFADRPHGFWGDDTKGDDGTAYDHWFEDATGFLRQINADGKLGPAVALMSRFPNDDARATVEKMDVWPAGKAPDFQKHQCVPYLEWHAPKTLKTKAIQIIYSGGCYTGNSPDGFEVAPARRFLNEKGMTVVTLKYRAPRPQNLAKHVTAWQDLQRAVRIVRDQAAKRGLDPNRIGIMGSSAGGHLTLMGATSSRHAAYNAIDELDRLPCKVQWAVGIYPAYALTDGLEVPNTTSGTDDSARLAPEFSFDPDTCPMVFVHGEADAWAAMNSVKAWEQLRRMGVQSDLHTLAGRNHCFQANASPGTGSYTWLNRIWEFMNHKGFNK
ncbi:MAG: alpha/beta hydrolase [Kiritimatiellae bacterium]|nr:alpha/beta hydrolase [Kiritimatiellia bacterium]